MDAIELMVLEDTPEQIHARRLERASHCFAPFRTRNKYNGGYRVFPKPCGEWRVCERCRRYRAKLLRERAERCEWQAMSKSGLKRRAYLVRLDVEDAKALMKREGKEWCWVMPQEGEDVVIVASEEEIGEQLTGEVIEALDWEALAVTAEGRKMSGNLGSKRQDPPTPSDGTVEVPEALFANISREAEEHAEEMAVRETPDLYPTTLEELQDAILARHKAFVGQVIKHGGRVVSYGIHREKVKLSDIDWHSYNSNKSAREVNRSWSKVKQE